RSGGIQGVAPFGCKGRPGGIQGVVPFKCEGRPAELGVVASLGGLLPSVLTSPSESDEGETNVEHVEPIARASEKGKGVASAIPLLTRKPQRRLKQKKLKINMKPLIVKMDEQAKQVGALTSELQSLKGELGRIKQVMQDLSVFVRAHLSIQALPAPTPANSSGPSQPEDVRPSGPSFEVAGGPFGPNVVEVVAKQSGPLGPIEDVSGPSGQVKSAVVPARAEDQAVALEHPSSSPLPTPPTHSPPSSSTAPLAPATLKQPLPKNISSSTPFPITSSSPASTTFIPPPPSEAPPASSSSNGASSSGPSSAEPSIPPPPPEYSFLHPSTPPSFVTIIPESAQLEHLEIQDIKDEFEEAILR
ncbi:hypothetical protein Taro_000948, partial [Colocasia esculenta]|nr:hypothetical protein [Colocasia esculenta]